MITFDPCETAVADDSVCIITSHRYINHVPYEGCERCAEFVKILVNGAQKDKETWMKESPAALQIIAGQLKGSDQHRAYDEWEEMRGAVAKSVREETEKGFKPKESMWKAHEDSGNMSVGDNANGTKRKADAAEDLRRVKSPPKLGDNDGAVKELSREEWERSRETAAQQ